MHEIYSKVVPLVNIKSIKTITGYDQIGSEYSAYLTDESKIPSKPFDFLFFPKNESELATIIQELSKNNVPTTIAGARTGLVGGSVPDGGALISLEFFDKVEAIFYDPIKEEWLLRAQSGLSLKSLDKMLRCKRFLDLEKSKNPIIEKELECFKSETQSYFYPPDPTEMSATLGGTVVTNASGARTYRYGPTRSWIRGIRVCLANGEIVDIPRGKYFASPAGKFIFNDSKGNASSFLIPDYPIPKTKSTTGIFTAPQMDLIDLFIGSEGIFGIVIRVDVALLIRDEKISVVQFLDSDEQAIELTKALRSDPRLQLDFLEFYSGNALNLLRKRQKDEPSTVGMPLIPEEAGSAIFFEMSFNRHTTSKNYDVVEEIVNSCGGSLNNSWAGYEEREMDRFKVFRHIVPETINSILSERKKMYPGLHKLGTDLAVPDKYLGEMWKLYQTKCDESKFEWLAFGHIGNNHIHVNILPKNMEELKRGLDLYTEFAQQTVNYGGAVSAEHGVGKIKGKFLKLMYTEDQISQMKKIKETLDPKRILNPNIIFNN